MFLPYPVISLFLRAWLYVEYIELILNIHSWHVEYIQSWEFLVFTSLQ